MSNPSAPPLLMTPGPSRVPDRVREAGARPMIHHRSPEFSLLLAPMLAGLRECFGTSGDVLPVHTSGRGGMEAAVANLFAPGDGIVACCNGKFGEMWADIAEAYGLVVHRVSQWGSDLDAGEVRAALSTHPGIRAVTMCQCDTSTGVLNDVASLAGVAHEADALLLVDAISSVGGVEFRFDEWDADIAVTASQKCLMSSAGLAFVAVSKRAWKATERSRLPRFYWDFDAIRKTLSKAQPQTPGSTPVHLVMQVGEALEMIREEGLSNVFARHLEMSRRATEGAQQLGLELLFGSLAKRSPTLTGVVAPKGLSAAEVRAGMKKRGILVAGGLGPLTDTAFRIGHLGDIRMQDVEHTLGALEEVLREHSR
jgi:aspartate aminotransferase-like enzyme